MRADYSETEYSGGMLKWFTIEIDAEDIAVVKMLRNTARKLAMSAIGDDRFEDAKRMTELAKELTKALEKAGEKISG